MTTNELTPKQAAFVKEYLVDLNATQAAIRAGYSARTADVQASRLLANVKVQAAIRAAMNERSERVEITADMVLDRWWQIASANPNDLMQYRRVNCRHCWGEDFAYQWQDEAEYVRTCERAVKDDKELPDDSGGYGFNAKRGPHPDCPQCDGEGMGYAHFHDTREVKGSAALLYAGVKVTKDGIELKVHDQAKALDNVARHLGMFTDKHELKHVHEYSDMTDEELDAEVNGLLKKTKH